MVNLDEFTMFEQEIASKIKKLPEPSKRKVLEFIELLEAREKANNELKSKLTFTWEGSLANLIKNKTSVELQHDALEWH